MKILTDIKEANNLIQKYIGGYLQIWGFHISHKRMSLRLTLPDSDEVIYLSIISCEKLSGSFSYKGANLFINNIYNEDAQEENYIIEDKKAEFKLVASGGIVLYLGRESEFGDVFSDFLKEEKLSFMNKALQNLKDAVTSIESKEEFILFVDALMRDLQVNPKSWTNSSLNLYLEGVKNWVKGMNNYYEGNKQTIPENINWKFVAELLMAGKVY